MKYLLFIALTLILSSCGLEKSVSVTAGGYESYRQAGYTDTQIKPLQRSDAAPSDTMVLYSSKKKK